MKEKIRSMLATIHELRDVLLIITAACTATDISNLNTWKEEEVIVLELCVSALPKEIGQFKADMTYRDDGSHDKYFAFFAAAEQTKADSNEATTTRLFLLLGTAHERPGVGHELLLSML